MPDAAFDEIAARSSLAGDKEEKGTFSVGVIGLIATFAVGAALAIAAVAVITQGFKSTTEQSCTPPGADQASCPYTVVNDLNGDQGATLSGVPYPKPASEGVARARRIEYEVVTVDNLPRAVEFYTAVMGGTEVDFCSGKDSVAACGNGYVSYSGGNHMTALFSSEVALSESVPNVSDSGDYEVRSVFVVLGNGVIQLMQFARRDNGEYFDLREPMTSPCWVGGGHIDFWIADSIDMNDYIEAAEDSAESRGMDKVLWNRPVPQTSPNDRDKVPKSKYANKVVGGAFGGLEWSYFKGATGEQLELYKITGTMKESIGRAYCDRGAVCSAFLPGKGEQTDKSLTRQMLGVFQFGFRTHNLDASVGFYTEVLGGTLITYPTHGLNIHADGAHWMILAKETLEAYEYASANDMSRAQAMREFGVANISSAGPMRLDHRFILFDNFVVEPLLYTDGLTFGGEEFNPRWSHSTSPAYIGTVGAAFGLETAAGESNLAKALTEMPDRALQRGFKSVEFPTEVAGFAADHPYAGLEYSYGKGPSGEVLVYVQMGGSFETTLKQAMVKNDVVSTRFAETDIFKNGGMSEFCSRSGVSR